MRAYTCDLCGARMGTCFADHEMLKDGRDFGSFSNTLLIKSWKGIPRQSTQIECGYDLCDDCAKAVHRKLMSIANSYAWRDRKERSWS